VARVGQRLFGASVLRVSSATQVALFRAAAEDIFEKDYQLTEGDISPAPWPAARPNTWPISESKVIGRSASAGLHPRDSAFGGLYGGATRPTHRGQGGIEPRAARARRRPVWGEVSDGHALPDEPAYFAALGLST